MWCGVVLCCVVLCCVVWCGVVWCCVVLCGVVLCGVVLCSVVLCGVVLLYYVVCSDGIVLVCGVLDCVVWTGAMLFGGVCSGKWYEVLFELRFGCASPHCLSISALPLLAISCQRSLLPQTQMVQLAGAGDAILRAEHAHVQLVHRGDGEAWRVGCEHQRDQELLRQQGGEP